MYKYVLKGYDNTDVGFRVNLVGWEPLRRLFAWEMVKTRLSFFSKIQEIKIQEF